MWIVLTSWQSSHWPDSSGRAQVKVHNINLWTVTVSVTLIRSSQYQLSKSRSQWDEKIEKPMQHLTGLAVAHRPEPEASINHLKPDACSLSLINLEWPADPGDYCHDRAGGLISMNDPTPGLSLVPDPGPALRDCNGISKLQLISPYKISCIRLSSEIPSLSLPALSSVWFSESGQRWPQCRVGTGASLGHTNSRTRTSNDPH